MYSNLFNFQENPIGKVLSVFPFYKILQMDKKRFTNVTKDTVSGRAQIQTQTNFIPHQCLKECSLSPVWTENTSWESDTGANSGKRRSCLLRMAR